MLGKYPLLNQINSPADLKRMDVSLMPRLAEEIRAFLVEKVTETGGHLASNLGVVELTVAIHRIFDSPRDHIIFDVGHQAYTHKLITGRRDAFDTLRTTGGLSGFTKRDESEHDPFGAGHSSTSVSAALGFAESDILAENGAYTVAVIGDGAYTGGMVHEALNNCRKDLKLIIILNENRMSISKNKGSFASYLARVRISKGYTKWKADTNSFLGKLGGFGRATQRFLAACKRKLKTAFYAPNYFEDLGLYYIGPVNGNDYKAVEKALLEAKRLGKCTVIHTYTKKGKGYEPAERSPDHFHSVNGAASQAKTLHAAVADELISIASEDRSVAAVTAAMGIGTGLSAFGEKYPERYFDVGIAEEHALTFGAGLAAAGMKPFVAIYSTFLQRGYDNIIHDIALQRLPVRLLIDRAGISVGDGATHHGIFDVAFLSHIPGITVTAPATFDSLSAAMKNAAQSDSPYAIRYANSTEPEAIKEAFAPCSGNDIGVRKNYTSDNVPECVFVTYGNITSRVLEAERRLKDEGISAGTVLVELIAPYEVSSANVAQAIKGARAVLYVEEGIENGGFAMICENRIRKDHPELSDIKTDIAAIKDFVIPHEKCDIYDYAGLSATKIYERMRELISR